MVDNRITRNEYPLSLRRGEVSGPGPGPGGRDLLLSAMSWLAEETAGVRAYLARLRQNFGTRFLLLLVSCVPVTDPRPGPLGRPH